MSRVLTNVALLTLLCAASPSHAKPTSGPPWGIRNVIFDFGGVLVDLDNKGLRRRFEPLFGPLESPRNQALFGRHQRGEIGAAAFRQALRARLGKRKLSDRQIDRIWGTQIGAVACRKLELIRALRAKGFRTYALSTTDPIHAELIKKRFGRCFPRVEGDIFAHLFDKAYLTFELGLLKPDPRIYRKVLAGAGIKANETLFIDDSMKNVLGAQRAGLFSFVVRDSSYLRWLPELLAKEKP